MQSKLKMLAVQADEGQAEVEKERRQTAAVRDECEAVQRDLAHVRQVCVRPLSLSVSLSLSLSLSLGVFVRVRASACVCVLLPPSLLFFPE